MAQRLMLPCVKSAFLHEPHRPHLWSGSPGSSWFCPGLRQMKFTTVPQIEEYLND